ncbi:subtilisin-like protease SBT5.4 [Impatiens glandulifera]|uniref:subtilisin-like protease SBT5.4 n=1 Tax=Impatiens glandulifera TaxID=253017 RepID=UPI001FB16D86|nr:subtilisin-like protease SBT5.4 [Impatiens glandulifera]
MDCQIPVCLVGFCFLSSFLLASASSAVKQPYVVYMGAHNHGEYDHMDDVGIEVKNSHRQFLSSFLSSKENADDGIINSYTKHINGFTALLDENQAAKVAKYPKVVSVFLNKARPLHTTHSWDFMNLEKVDNDIQVAVDSNSLWRKAKYGEDVIIANIDTGVWPESKSFSDDGYGPIPSRWKGFCQNNTSVGVPCNKKLIGARYFNKAYKSDKHSLPPSMISARDFHGHGSHTLSTAGGNFVQNASIFGVGNGTAKGGSPRARVASYKVCWPMTTNESENGPMCNDGDILEAMDAAIHDGVDVISISAGGKEIDHMTNAISIGGFHAVKKGIVVVVTAGNKGAKGNWTVQNLSPWLFTVAASSTDRQFQAIIKLGNGQTFVGASVSKSLPKDDMYPIISAADAAAKDVSPSDALLCKDESLDPKKVKGKLLVCLNDKSSISIEKGFVAAEVGAVGMILCNDKSIGNRIREDPHFLPTSNVNYTDGLAIFEYIKSNKNPTGHISATKVKLDVEPSPSMAFFSSKGPNKLTPGILKPDITAPGVGIIAAHTGSKSASGEEFDKRTTEYIMKSGTSMACPHVSGVIGLLRKLHPDWSPAAIKSALMTTATTRDNTGKSMLDADLKTATPFHYGAGHIRPNRANDPGLVYDLSIVDHLNFLCAHGYNETLVRHFSGISDHTCSKNASLLDYNYPSITIPDLSKPVIVTRTLKNVGQPGTYVARVRTPHGISVSVNPSALNFSRIGEEKKFKMKIEKEEGVKITMEFVHGELLWFDKHDHKVRSPLVFGFGLKPPSPRDED